MIKMWRYVSKQPIEFYSGSIQLMQPFRVTKISAAHRSWIWKKTPHIFPWTDVSPGSRLPHMMYAQYHGTNRMRHERVWPAPSPKQAYWQLWAMDPVAPKKLVRSSSHSLRKRLYVFPNTGGQSSYARMQGWVGKMWYHQNWGTQSVRLPALLFALAFVSCVSPCSPRWVSCSGSSLLICWLGFRCFRFSVREANPVLIFVIPSCCLVFFSKLP